MKRRVMWRPEMPTARGIGERVFSCRTGPPRPTLGSYGTRCKVVAPHRGWNGYHRRDTTTGGCFDRGMRQYR